MEVIVVIYMLGAVAAVIAATFLILLFLRQRLGALSTLVIIFIPYVILGMVKIRCTFDAPFPCGWMSFIHGVTWHVIVSAVIVGLVGFVVHRFRLTEAVKPLGGAWLALFWILLPVSVIHPPSHGGPCPRIPVVCHDLPLFSLGGLFYWLLPFFIWSMVRVASQVLSSWNAPILRGNRD